MQSLLLYVDKCLVEGKIRFKYFEYAYKLHSTFLKIKNILILYFYYIIWRDIADLTFNCLYILLFTATREIENGKFNTLEECVFTNVRLYVLTIRSCDYRYRYLKFLLICQF